MPESSMHNDNLSRRVWQAQLAQPTDRRGITRALIEMAVMAAFFATLLAVFVAAGW